MNSATKPARGATRDDVAKLAGVSSAVVSYVVNDGPRPVADATRAKVLAAIEKLGYRPNAAARSLMTGRSDLVGLIVPDVRNPYFSALAQAVEVEARAEGVNLVLAQGTTGKMAPLIESLSGHLVAGIITSSIPEPEAVEALVRGRVNVVRLSIVPPGVDATSVLPDFHGGTVQAVRHLIEVHGHRRIALVAGSDQPGVAGIMDERERAWHDLMNSAGLATDAVIRVGWSSSGGRDAAARLVHDLPDCTAVFTMSDQQAIGLISGLDELHKAVPGDIAITSFDGSPEAEFTIPPLTTSSVPMADMARAAVRQLLHGGRRGRIFPTELVVRRSCGCP